MIGLQSLQRYRVRFRVGPPQARLSPSPGEICAGTTLVFFLLLLVVMRDFLSKVYDKLYYLPRLRVQVTHTGV